MQKKHAEIGIVIIIIFGFVVAFVPGAANALFGHPFLFIVIGLLVVISFIAFAFKATAKDPVVSVETKSLKVHDVVRKIVRGMVWFYAIVIVGLFLLFN